MLDEPWIPSDHLKMSWYSCAFPMILRCWNSEVPEEPRIFLLDIDNATIFSGAFPVILICWRNHEYVGQCLPEHWACNDLFVFHWFWNSGGTMNTSGSLDIRSMWRFVFMVSEVVEPWISPEHPTCYDVYMCFIDYEVLEQPWTPPELQRSKDIVMFYWF